MLFVLFMKKKSTRINIERSFLSKSRLSSLSLFTLDHMSPSSFSIRCLFRCLHSFLTLIIVSLCLFVLSILTYITLRKHLMPVSHLIIPLPLTLTTLSSNSITTLISHVNLTDPMNNYYPLDISSHSYRVEFDCYVPRSYINRHVGSFAVYLTFYSSSNQLIIEQSRLILFPYQSDIVRLVRTILFLPLSIFHLIDDRWHCEQILINRLSNDEKSKRFLQLIQMKISPSTFQLDQCQLHFHVLDLTGLAYSFFHYPILTGCLASCILFSIYMTFYVIITGLAMLNQTNKNLSSCKED